MSENAVLFGPFVGEMYWEAGRFAPMLPFYIKHKYKKQKPKYIIYTREDRFDLYGKNADILVPLKIEGDYKKYQPNCFRLNNFSKNDFDRLVNVFRKTYQKRFNVLQHIVPDVSKACFLDKNQFSTKEMIFNYEPRDENLRLVSVYLPTNKPIVVLASRFRNGFKRNWKYWPEFYNLLASDKKLMEKFNFVICGKKEEYIPDEKHRFYDMTDIKIGSNSSLVGLLLSILKQSSFVFGSQSAIPNLALLYRVPVLEFGCQKVLHTKT